MVNEIRELWTEGNSVSEITSEVFLDERNWNDGKVYEGWPVKEFGEIYSYVKEQINANASDWEAEEAQRDIEDQEYMAYEGN